MQEHGFCLTHIFPSKDTIDDYVLSRENTVQRKSVFWHMLRIYFPFANTLKYNIAAGILKGIYNRDCMEVNR